ncbi:MAG TPA: hypothetical protein DHV08_12665 [Rhodocyclaceae bacterium]|nr:MAG: hypothetical protein AUK49_03845 [Betaproteobacteria bacterium CG2_30_68_42]PJA56734.1 MAG: hypothetical protein CO164_11495 [Rhodocyclales bacterium CG_4_9_14_3_um_filter_68_10]HCX34298.1 hypothetical protein [Rhodocyclaceae bacterium]
MNLGLTDKVALVSGASRGIGFAIAAGFAAEGCKVAITARNQGLLHAAAERLADSAGAGRVLAIAADMADEGAVADLLERVESRLGPVDAAVANAGSGAARDGIELTRSDWQAALDANLFPAVVLAGALLPRMAARRQGSLTLVSSIAGIEAIGAPIPYAAAKAALDAAVKGYAQWVGAAGVRVNAVAPGNVFFPGGSWARKFEDAGSKALFLEYIEREVPLRRFATPREIADVVVFLASARAGFVTGAVVAVDGGQLRSV